MQSEASDTHYTCKVCLKEVIGKTGLVEHLRNEHEVLEVISYAATTMMLEEDRDRIAMEFHRQFEHIKKELTGED